jgi:hypothetical protein
MSQEAKENWPIYDMEHDYNIKERNLSLKGGCGTNV